MGSGMSEEKGWLSRLRSEGVWAVVGSTLQLVWQTHVWPIVYGGVVMVTGGIATIFAWTSSFDWVFKFPAIILAAAAGLWLARQLRQIISAKPNAAQNSPSDGASTCVVGGVRLPLDKVIARADFVGGKLAAVEASAKAADELLPEIEERLSKPNADYRADVRLQGLISDWDMHLSSIDNSVSECLGSDPNISRRAYIVDAQPVPPELGLSDVDRAKYKRFFQQVTALRMELPAHTGKMRNEAKSGTEAIRIAAQSVRLQVD